MTSPADPSDPESVAALRDAVRRVARLIEDTVPEAHRGLHKWLELPAVRAARAVPGTEGR